MRIGFLGGSFDPVHRGHLALARACLEGADLDRVVLVVAGTPPHKRDRRLAAAHHRLEMARRAVAGDARLEVDGRETLRDGPCYTIDTVRELARDHPDDERFWIIGADTLPELPTWRHAAELLDRIGILAATRTGFDPEEAIEALVAPLGEERARQLAGGFISMPPVDVSSTDIRERVRSGRSIHGLVPESVAEYIRENGLYA
jgi:nicotinate-nucleotide adenylyltransferase